jgi:hypothetical protein
MAWRLDEAVEHGIIDNTVEGTTTGKIWLAGRDEPLILSLDGDCWRDLAGTVLEFENPSPRACAESETFDIDQTGIIGDITASRKARIPAISEAEIIEYHRQDKEIPCRWRNIFYMEWFSESNGRVLIEAAGYQMNISDQKWQMDEDMEEAQKLANMNTMRDFMAQIIRRDESSEVKRKARPESSQAELDEFEWEERLKESDRLSDAYQEVLEKYIDDPDAERIEAFVMGWDGLLGAMADREESEESFDFESETEDWQDTENADEDEDDEEEEHPLQRHAYGVALRSLDVISPAGEENGPGYLTTSRLMRISAKLAGVLNGRISEYQPESGFVLAVLKRCLSWTNEALGGCNELIEAEQDADQAAALERLRSEVFEIRDGIIEMRRLLKQS